ncbi:strictosidine synthase [Dictyocaulus viviparus]|uniref:Strictosidine synthase n=1 Tax=Dictyocaulus viviparus TaxID=29172 RepID=A0A0D8XQ64_DICVI|nr:strictosidine synthase [Dictyocaulus viviparus]
MGTTEVRQFFSSAAYIDNDDTAPPTRYLNDFDFLSDGQLVISESSTKFDDRDFIYDILEHRPNGRILRYNIAKNELSVLLDNLYFPNGIQVVQKNILIAEMGSARILKILVAWGEAQDGKGGFVPQAAQMPKLKYNCKIETSAKNHARRCKFEHSKKATSKKLGENLVQLDPNLDLVQATNMTKNNHLSKQGFEKGLARWTIFTQSQDS